ncbi:winged helix-turn-helix transcriptional regulator [Martelella mediterranea]|jgi:DNA-binding HxlR family transcriptional regulator|uniref:Putative HTH-type transcriptional regulator YybR n=1 Tax=Martelella mediterranea DSM 17316 TaxID=1122214 RepID=A0A1U9YXE8_9HYPH|nr:helix-turn-helix domain-containing protein [Martelella mediterranea]AQZ50108.1 putative HTH-type transcriptional regulator YybR [Martelella mediterranea DSM 17316]
MHPDHLPEDCRPISNLLSRIGDKWTILVMRVLEQGEPIRFKELHRAIGGISQRMLTVTLRHLERDGLVIRTVYPTIPPRVEYELSERGLGLQQAMVPLFEWTKDNARDIYQSQIAFDLAKDKAVT